LSVPSLEVQPRRPKRRDPLRKECEQSSPIALACGGPGGHHLRLALLGRHRARVGTAQDSGERGHRFRVPRPPESALGVPVSSAGGLRKHGRNSTFRDGARCSFVRQADIESEGHSFRTVSEVTFRTPRGAVTGAVESQLFGLGIDVVRHRGIGRSCTLLTVTPIDGDLVEARYTFLFSHRRGVR
jgi:hypothetical protein